MMKLKFRLKPIKDITSWRTEQGHSTLSWYGLTDGWFWIELGDQALFRYSEEVLNYWSHEYPDTNPPLLPYEGYQVARYWEDLMEMLPAILDPLPPDLAVRVYDAQAWQVWQEMAMRWLEGGDQTSSDVYSTAVSWWWNRCWNAAHLAYPPYIWMWRVSNDIHIRWDNRDVMVGGVPVWTAEQGQCILPVSEFLNAIEVFHNRFLAEMEHRVNDAVGAWPRSDVEIDLDALTRGQTDRLGSLKPAIDPWAAEVRRGFSWEEVTAALANMEQSFPRRPPL